MASGVAVAPAVGKLKDPYLDNSLDSGVDGLRDSPNNSSDDIPSYIIDPTTRTTYLKGKFLGKVSPKVLQTLSNHSKVFFVMAYANSFVYDL